MKVSLAQKFVLVIEVVVVVFAMFGGAATYVIMQRSLVERTKAQLMSISVLKEGAVKEYVGHARSEIEFYAKAQRSQDILRSTIRVPQDRKLNEVASLFSEIIKDEHTFRDVMLLDLRGEVIFSSNLQDEGKIKDIDSMMGQFYYDVTTNETAMAISVPIEGEDGERMGVLAARLGIDEISKLMIERSGLGETGETFLVNFSNVVITELLKEPGAVLKKTIFLPQIELCLAGESNFDGEVDYLGETVFGYWKWFPEIGSCLVTKMDRSEALAPIRRATTILLGMVGVIGVMVGLFGYAGGRSIIRPLGQLRDEANKIKQGDFDVEVEIETGDEIEEVAVAFNEMTQKLKEMYSGLEDKVKAKTVELSKKLEELAGLNTTLGQNEVAMVNLLEDAKDLEEKLKIEKEGIEKQVSERTRELSQERAELLAVINSISRGLVVVDKNWKVILENATMGAIMGTTQKINYPDVAEFLHSELDLDKMVAESFAKQSEVRGEPKLIGTRYLDVHTVPVMHGEAAGAVAIFVKDVTEALTVQRSRDEFFSIASHELRTPLTAIRGNAGMILDNYRDKLPDKDIVEMLNDIHEGSERLITIVNDFLNVSRLEMGKMEFKKESVDLSEVVRGVIKEFEVTGSRQKVDIKVEVDSGPLPNVLADADRLKQVFFNLIGNGLKFTKDGAIVVKLSVVETETVVMVTDTGEGIPKEMQGLLFHKFQQAGSSLYTRDTSKGTGLGLYISKLMMEGMGGKIWLENSEVGKGSTFGISLPIVKA